MIKAIKLLVEVISNILFRKNKTENNPQYRQIVSDMKVLVTVITNTPERYFNIDERISVKNRIENVLNEIAKYHIKSNYYGYQEYYVLKMVTVDILTKLNKLNEVFIRKTLEEHKNLFDNIDGKSLDEQQRKAIVTDEKHNLIVAGAGSGKTLTILGKVLYLLECGVAPKEILLIAFTKKSAGELEERVNRNLSLGISVATFHKLGLDIITKNHRRPNIDDNIDTYIEDYFLHELIKYPDEVQRVIEFIGYYFNIPLELKADGTLGDKIEREQNADLETLNDKYKKAISEEKKTIKGERVKSIEELMIANFLFLNSVEYEYERAYPFETDTHRKRYQPDFYLVDYDIYLEHFGIDKNNRCPWLSWIEEQKYIEGIKWKRDLHAAHRTKLIETYSYFQSDRGLIANLRDILLSNKVALKPMSRDVMSLLIEEISTEDSIKEFRKLCGTFLKLFKSNSYTETHFNTLRQQFAIEDKKTSQFTQIRTLHFISIIEKLYSYYQSRLNHNNAIDFADMINMATEIVKEGRCDINYKYIIIDEYQDISMDRYRLVKTIIEKTSAHLMCVGDDWQSIYRFAGSDANLFMSFNDYWGYTQTSKIENTYRNSQELINIASSFVMKNSKQISKVLRSQKSCKKPICLYYYNSDNLVSVLEKLLRYIVEEFGEEAKIMLLGRTSYDIDLLRFKKGTEDNMNKKVITPFIIKGNSVKHKKYSKLSMEFFTVHKAKGLEADNVIILNMKNDKLGFPNKIADDPLLQLLLPKSDSFAFAEERRLFYVALTRTKNRTFLLVPDRNASEFIKEIQPLCHLEAPDGENLIINNPTCPKCQTGRLLLRQAKENDKYFVGCSHFPSCDFTNNNTSIIEHPIKCPKCGGFLVARSGKYGDFLGCTNYPDCKLTIER